MEREQRRTNQTTQTSEKLASVLLFVLFESIWLAENII